jgi:phosphinothricin acetyltransferase
VSELFTIVNISAFLPTIVSNVAELLIRTATTNDAAACAQIYAPYVTDSVISFEAVPPTHAEMATRIAAALERYAWLVAEDDGRVVGYAYAHAFAERAAYRWACETSIYLELGRRRTGAGRLLYEALFRQLAQRGYRWAMAGMTIPNDATSALHAALGFTPVGVYRQVGWKNGSWHDVAWAQKAILAVSDPPDEPH